MLKPSWQDLNWLLSETQSMKISYDDGSGLRLKLWAWKTIKAKELGGECCLELSSTPGVSYSPP